MNFCQKTFELLEPVPQGSELIYKAGHTGIEYKAGPKETLLYEQTSSGFEYEKSKHANELRVAASNPVNSRVISEVGCNNCGNKLLSVLRVGVTQKNFYSCACGNNWSF